MEVDRYVVNGSRQCLKRIRSKSSERNERKIGFLVVDEPSLLNDLLEGGE